MTPFRKLVIIDGNIGAGKSTMLNHLKSSASVVFPEPVQEWARYKGLYPFLDIIYSDNVKGKTVANFQQLVLNHFDRVITRLEMQFRDTAENVIAVVERSPLSGLYIFTTEIIPNEIDSNWVEYAILKDRYEIIANRFLQMVKDGHVQVHTIFLDPQPDFCIRNVHSRGDINAEAISIIIDSLSKKYQKAYSECGTLVPFAGEITRFDPTTMNIREFKVWMDMTIKLI
jgi:deoxyadenosine/deoxycytidine kinase